MSSYAGTVKVRLEADKAAFDKAWADAQKTVVSGAKAMETATKAAGAIFASLAGTLGIAAHAYAETREAQNRLNQAIANSGKAISVAHINELAASLQKTTTVSDDAAVAAAAMMASFGLTEDQITSLLPRAADLAAALGGNVQDAAQTMGRAMVQGSAALRGLGLGLNEAQRKAFDAADAHGRMAMMMELVDKRARGMAAAIAETTSGKLEQLKNAVGDVFEEIGKATEGPIIAVITAMTDAAAGFADELAHLGPEMKSAAGLAALVATGVAGIATAVLGVVAVLPSLAAGFKLVGLTTLPALAPILATIAAVAAGIAGAILIVGALRRAWSADLGGMRTAILGWVQTIVKAWDAMVDFMTQKIKGISEWLTEKLVIAGSMISGDSPEQAQRTLSEARKGGGIFATGDGSGAQDFFKKMEELAKDSWGEIKASWNASGVPDVVGMMANAMRGASETVATAGGKLGTSLDEASKSVSKKFRTVFDDMQSAFGAAAERFAKLADLQEAAAKAEEAEAEAAEKNAVQYASASDMVANSAMGLAGKMGDAGDIINAGAQGFANGGPVGAIVAIIFEVLGKLRFFGESMDIVNDDLGVLFDSLSDAFSFITDTFKAMSRMLQPLFKALGAVLEPVGNILENTIWPVLEILGPLLEGVTYILKGLATILLGVQLGLELFANFMIDIATEFMRFIGNFTDTSKEIQDLQKARFNIEADAKETFGNIWAKEMGAGGNTGHTTARSETQWERWQREQAEAAEDTTGGIVALGEATAGATEQMQKATAELVNIPTGFKIARARFDAIDPMGGSNELGPGGLQGVAGGGVMITGPVTVVANNPEEFMRAMRQAQKWDNFAGRGTPFNAGGEFSQRRSGS